MRPFFYVLMMLLGIVLVSCEQETISQPHIPLHKAIAGNWLVTYQKVKSTNFAFEDQQEGVVTEWGAQYLLMLNIKQDGTYYVDGAGYTGETPTGHNSTDSVLEKTGTWHLNKQQQVTFTCKNNHQTTFRARIDEKGRLILENKELLLRHSLQP